LALKRGRFQRKGDPRKERNSRESFFKIWDFLLVLKRDNSNPGVRIFGLK